MTKSEALHVLKCSSIDEIDDAYEDLMFDFKGKVLQIIPPIKILIAIIKKVDRINIAYAFFGKQLSDTNRRSSDLNLQLSLSVFLNNYQLELADAKLQLSKSQSGIMLNDSIGWIIDIQKNLFIKLESYLPDEIVNLDEFEIKLSENIDVFKIQNHLKELQLDDNKISEYIRKQIIELESTELSCLTKSILNSAKQIVFNGIRGEV